MPEQNTADKLLDWFDNESGAFLEHRHGNFQIRRGNNLLTGLHQTLRGVLSEAFTAKTTSEPTVPAPSSNGAIPEAYSEWVRNSPVGPVPPRIKAPAHHWLEVFDSDGHSFGIVVAQWNPGAQRWSSSGNVGTGAYLHTEHWRYVAPCPMPEFDV